MESRWEIGPHFYAWWKLLRCRRCVLLLNVFHLRREKEKAMFDKKNTLYTFFVFSSLVFFLCSQSRIDNWQALLLSYCPSVLLSHSLKVLSFSCRTLAGVGVVLRRGCLLNKNVKICVLCVYDFSDFCGRNMRCSSGASGELRRCFVAFSGRPLAAKKN